MPRDEPPVAVIRWLFTCEHGGNTVPARWTPLFEGAEAVLESHRGFDAGALCVYRTLAPRFADAAFDSQVTRLLADLNRSPGHRKLFSEFTRGLPQTERESILATHYRPWREGVVSKIDTWRARGDKVIHVSVHSFTSHWHGVERNADIGLLYDPARSAEREICRRWRMALRACAAGYRVRMNYPYRGNADGFTTWLRRRHTDGYAGIELETNEALVGRDCTRAAALIGDALAAIAGDTDGLAAAFD